MTDDDDLLAAELALGLLDEPDRSAAALRASADAAFAARVEAWRERMAPLLGAEEVPDNGVWERVTARLAANDDGVPAAALKRWRALAIAASAIAASLALMLLVRPAALPPPVAPVLVAALHSDQSPAVVTISLADRGERLLVTPIRLDSMGRAVELWVIPADGKARSLGLLDPAVPSSVPVAAAHRPHVHAGATLAISLEPPGGAPAGARTGPIAAAGKIASIKASDRRSTT